MKHSTWLERTKGNVFHRKRSPLLQALDKAFEKYERTDTGSDLVAFHEAFIVWMISKNGRDSLRNANGAVDELVEWLEELMRTKAPPRAPGAPPVFPPPKRTGPSGNPFEEAAKKARERAAAQERDREVVDVEIAQTITYAPGMSYQKWNATTSSWASYVVPGPASEDMTYRWTVKLDLILRGTILEVKVQASAEAGVTESIQRAWTTHILAAWNNRAKLVDKDTKKSYEVQFSLHWVPPGSHVYPIGLGDTTPTVQQTGAVLLLPSAPGNFVYLSELRALALAAPDLAAFKASHLAGTIKVYWYDNTTSAWKDKSGTSGTLPELADLMRSIDSTATFKVKDVKSTNKLGPWKVSDPQLRRLIASGMVTATTPTMKTGEHAPKKAGDVPEFLGFLTPEAERKAWETARNKTVNTAVFGEADRKAIAHEFGHLIGCPDEYEVSSIGANTGQVHIPAIHNAVRFTTNSVMNNPTVGLIEERHFAFVLKHYRAWQARVRSAPCTAEIEMVKVREKDPVGTMNVREALAYMLIRQRQGRDDDDDGE